METTYPIQTFVMFFIMSLILILLKYPVCLEPVEPKESDKSKPECSKEYDVLFVPSGVWTLLGAIIILGLTFFFMYMQYKDIPEQNKGTSVFYAMMCVYIFIIIVYTIVGALAMFSGNIPFIKRVSIPSTKVVQLILTGLHAVMLIIMLLLQYADRLPIFNKNTVQPVSANFYS